jgi:hypothetical protein
MLGAMHNRESTLWRAIFVSGADGRPKALTCWFHFVQMPVQVGAATSPQAILAPLEVEFARDATRPRPQPHEAGDRRYRALMLKARGDMCRATRLAIIGAVVSRNFLKCAVARCASKAVASS